MTTLKKQKNIGPRTKRGQKMATIDYKDDFLMKDLRDIDRAAEYLTAAIEEGEAEFLLAIRDLVEAQGGIGNLAKITKLNRENLYAMLSEDGNPRLYSLTSVLSRLGLGLKFTRKLQGVKAA